MNSTLSTTTAGDYSFVVSGFVNELGLSGASFYLRAPAGVQALGKVALNKHIRARRLNQNIVHTWLLGCAGSTTPSALRFLRRARS